MDAAGTSKKMMESIMASLGQPRFSIERIVATGFSGRVIDMADETVREIGSSHISVNHPLRSC
jgi:hypothetical protein